MLKLLRTPVYYKPRDGIRKSMDLIKPNNDEEVTPCHKEDNSDRYAQCPPDNGDLEVACDSDHDTMTPRKRIGPIQRWVIVVIVCTGSLCV